VNNAKVVQNSEQFHMGRIQQVNGISGAHHSTYKWTPHFGFQIKILVLKVWDLGFGLNILS